MSDTPKAEQKSRKCRPTRASGRPPGRTRRRLGLAAAQTRWIFHGFETEFRHHAVPRRHCGDAASALVLWHLEGFTDGLPHGLGIHAVGEGALDRTPAQLTEHEVLGHALRVDVAELRIH